MGTSMIRLRDERIGCLGLAECCSATNDYEPNHDSFEQSCRWPGWALGSSRGEREGSDLAVAFDVREVEAACDSFVESDAATEKDGGDEHDDLIE